MGLLEELAKIDEKAKKGEIILEDHPNDVLPVIEKEKKAQESGFLGRTIELLNEKKDWADLPGNKAQDRNELINIYKKGLEPWEKIEKDVNTHFFEHAAFRAKAILGDDKLPIFEIEYADGTYGKKHVIRVLEKPGYNYLPKVKAFDDICLRDDVYEQLMLKRKDKASEFLVEGFMKENHVFSIRSDEKDEIWVYEKGIYIPNGKTHIQEFCRRILKKSYTTHILNNVISKIQADTFIDQNKFFINENPNLIPVENGIFDINSNKLKKFSHKYRFFTKVPIAYNPEVENSVFDDFFSGILRYENDVLIMQELFGYSLYRDFPTHKCFMFNGNGRNGKGKTIELLKLFVGPDNCTDLSIKDMEQDNFTINRLHNKMLNLSGDIDGGFIQQSGLFKKLTGGDLVTTKRKFKTDLTFQNFSKMVFACNHLPNFSDDSHGFWERWCLLDFPYTFVNKSEYNSTSEKQRISKKMKLADPKIISNLFSEENKSALLNWALKGLRRILDAEEFSQSNTREEVEKEWKRKSSPVLSFMEDETEIDYHTKTLMEEFQKEYTKYCMKQNKTPESMKSIEVTLNKEYGVFRHKTNSGLCLVGFKIKSTNYPEDLKVEKSNLMKEVVK